jgi:hypothetical protein
MAELSDLDRLIAIEEIKNLKARRIRALDLQDWATYEALHAPDYVADHGEHGRMVGAKAVAERLAQNHAGKTTIHHVHSPQIDILSPTQATGVWAMEDRIWWKQGEEEHWSHGWGFYYETYEKRDGTWVFTSRRLKHARLELSEGARLVDLEMHKR